MKKNLKQMRSFSPCKLQVRETATGRTISGYAIVFNSPSVVLAKGHDYEEREVISPKAVTTPFLDQQDIKMTLFHDRQLILARSNKGKGTLSYEVDAHGVKFSFVAPKTADGDKAVELVRRGDIAGCSFMFLADVYDPEYAKTTTKTVGGIKVLTRTIIKMDAVLDFTLAADPAYPDTSVSARERKAAAVARTRAKADNISETLAALKRDRNTAIAAARRFAEMEEARLREEWLERIMQPIEGHLMNFIPCGSMGNRRHVDGNRRRVNAAAARAQATPPGMYYCKNTGKYVPMMKDIRTIDTESHLCKITFNPTTK